MRRWGRRIAAATIVAGSVGLGAVALGSVPAAAAGPVVTASCVGIDPGPPAKQIRIGLLVSGTDGLYRVALAGPDGPAQGEGRIAGGRGLVVVPVPSTGDYTNVVITDVDTGQTVDPGSLAAAVPVKVGTATVACDPAALVASGPASGTGTGTTDPTVVALGDGSTTTTAGTGGAAPTPAGSEPSVAAPAATTTTDTPPWLLLLIPGVLLVGGGVVLLVRARPGSRSR